MNKPYFYRDFFFLIYQYRKRLKNTIDNVILRETLLWISRKSISVVKSVLSQRFV